MLTLIAENIRKWRERVLPIWGAERIIYQYISGNEFFSYLCTAELAVPCIFHKSATLPELPSDAPFYLSRSASWNWLIHLSVTEWLRISRLSSLVLAMSCCSQRVSTILSRLCFRCNALSTLILLETLATAAFGISCDLPLLRYSCSLIAFK
jgi:hypothetical protein